MVLPLVFADARTRAGRLADRTSFGVGGVPEFLFEPGTKTDATLDLTFCRRHGVAVRVLGGGSNLLVGDGVLEGAVVATRRLRAVRVLEDRVEVGAGVPLGFLVRRAGRWSIPALSGCVGIPGSVGGAVLGNAGGRFGCVGEALLEVRGVDERGRPFARRVRSGDLGYRECVFEGCLVTGAVFRRDEALEPGVEERLLSRALAHKRATQPLGARSAGCTFRNPAGDPRSAGRLIEEAGLKGRRVGGAVVSDQHANFILNDGHATARDIGALIRSVRREVKTFCGVDLELEVRVWT